ncbi:hypothetical protein ACHAXT_003015 [Thalassiosira profunda]
MAINDDKPYDPEDWEDEAWEMVTGQEDAALLAAEAELELREAEETVQQEAEVHAVEQDAGEGDATADEIAEEPRAHKELEDDASAVSSITRDHPHVSDVEDDEEEAEQEREAQECPGDGDLLGRRFSFGNQKLAAIPSLAEAEPQAAGLAEVGGSATLTGRGHGAHPLDLAEEDEEGKLDDEPDPLVETLSQMGFARERIERAIEVLRGAGDAEIDADTVIGEMEGEARPGAQGGTWDFVESNIRDFEEQHQIRHRTQACMHNLNQSAREFFADVREESQRFRSNLQAQCEEADVRVRDATQELGHRASAAGEQLRQANEEHRVLEKVAAAAAVGGAALLALGNPRAGAGALAVAGASLAAGEAMRQGSTRAGGAYARDYGLNEDLHLD